MALATPSRVSAANVNSELGIATNTLLKTANNWVKNVASIPNSTNLVNYGKLRWGINFPGRTVGYDSYGGGATNSPAYNLSGNINLSAFSVQGPGGTAEAQVYIQIQSNGTFRLYATGAGGFSQFTRTWLTSGVNSDYTARVELSGGSMSAGSSTINFDHSLSSDRIWINYISSSGSYTVGPEATGNLIIKSAGTELIRRKFTMSTSASVEIA